MVYSHVLAKFIVGVLGWCFVVVCGVVLFGVFLGVCGFFCLFLLKNCKNFFLGGGGVGIKKYI